ncbi:MAG: LysR family transcriptional regulator [Opitutales bacterium]|nr:LysR family transcriptional regulator [Opitutales bacterium]
MPKNTDSQTKELGLDNPSNHELFRRRGVSLDRLRSFCLVVKAGSIVGAAEGDIPTQTLYSRQIGELQTALGFPLFSKEGRVLKPTPEGLRLANIVEGFFGAVAEEVADARSARVPLNIGCGDAVTRWILGPTLPLLTKRFPNFEFNVEHGSTTTTIESVRRVVCTWELSIIRRTPVVSSA